MGPLGDLMWNYPTIYLRQTAHPPMEHTARQNSKLYCIELIKLMGFAIFREKSKEQIQSHDLHKF